MFSPDYNDRQSFHQCTNERTMLRLHLVFTMLVLGCSSTRVFIGSVRLGISLENWSRIIGIVR